MILLFILRKEVYKVIRFLVFEMIFNYVKIGMFLKGFYCYFLIFFICIIGIGIIGWYMWFLWFLIIVLLLILLFFVYVIFYICFSGFVFSELEFVV